jgi:biotin operon repressor
VKPRTAAIEAADILALLEDGPHSQAELVAWLEQPAAVVRFLLKAMQRDGVLKKVGLEKKWALVSYEATNGRPIVVDHKARHAAILACLVDGPLSTQQLMDRLKESRKIISFECGRLLKGAKVQRVRLGRYEVVWALPDWKSPRIERKPPVQAKPVPPTPRPVQTVKKDVLPSWWVTAPANGFTELATSQLERMQESKHSRVTPAMVD